MSRAGLAPLVAELSCSACEAHSHIGVAECEDRAFLIDALSYDELEVAVAVLSDAEVCDVACRRVELCEVSASKYQSSLI